MADRRQARGVVELMFLTAWADGRFEGSEALTIHKLAVQVPELREVGATNEIDFAAKRSLRDKGLDEAVRDAAASICDTDYRELAFRACARVSGADGSFNPQEAKVLDLLRSIWQFTPADVERLLVLASRG